LELSSKALIISAQNYSRYPKLQGPDSDAYDFQQWLLNFDPACQVTTVGAQGSPEGRPTGDEIKLALGSWLDEKPYPNGQPIADRAYIYYSGHGIAPNPDDAQIVSANATPKVLLGASGRAILNYLEKGGYFREIVLIMDCCRDTTSSDAISLDLPIFNDPLALGTKRFIAFATSFPLKSKEYAIPPGNQVRGLFTAALLEGLKGKAAPDIAGKITGKSLNDYVQNRLPDLLKDCGVDFTQPPRFEPADSDMDFGTAPPPTQSLLISTRPDQVGNSIRILIGQNQVFAQTTAGPSLWSVPAPPGVYIVIDDMTSETKSAFLKGVDYNVDF